MVIDHGAVPIFVKLLSSPSDDVREQVYARKDALLLSYVNGYDNLKFENTTDGGWIVTFGHIGSMGIGKYCW